MHLEKKILASISQKKNVSQKGEKRMKAKTYITRLLNLIFAQFIFIIY